MTLILILGLGVTSSQSAEEAAVDNRVEELFAAINKGDAKAFVARYTENGVKAQATDTTAGRGRSEEVQLSQL